MARGQFSRLAQYEIEVESPLRPKEIQDRIRAGETADEIADAAGIPIERVRRFEGPVLAERDYRAQEAQRATIRGPGDSGPGPRLGDIVAERLAECGANADDALWDSRKRSDGSWQVQLMFAAGNRPQMAEWVFDPRRRHAMPADDNAARLSFSGPDRRGRPGPAEPATATVTPIARRLGQQQHPAEQRAEPEQQTGPRRGRIGSADGRPGGWPRPGPGGRPSDAGRAWRQPGRGPGRRGAAGARAGPGQGAAGQEGGRRPVPACLGPVLG